MKIEKKEFYCSTVSPYLPSAFKQLQEFVDKLKREDVITIQESETQPGYRYTLIYWANEEEE